jgi:hypothetical protein
MKKLFIVIGIMLVTGCVSIKPTTIQNNFPKTFDEAEMWVENQFKPIKIDTNSTYMLILPAGDTIYHNKQLSLTIVTN